MIATATVAGHENVIASGRAFHRRAAEDAEVARRFLPLFLGQKFQNRPIHSLRFFFHGRMTGARNVHEF